jgi:hypothetical protein
MFPFHRLHALRVCAVLVLLAVAPAQAGEPGELRELRAQLDALKSDYQARINVLESRVAQLEAQVAAQPQPQPPAPVALPEVLPEVLPPATPAPSGAGAGGANAFNPAISVILGGRYAQLDADPASYRVAGFMPASEEAGPGRRGFELGESELTLAANVDPWFYASLTASLSGENTVSVEEAYIRTLALPSGLSLKAGRFFSGIGYLNEVHSHAWDFVDQPLAYQALFGGQLAQDGAQLKWIAPTDLYIEMAAETGDGGQYPGTHLAGNGVNGGALLAHLGNDIGDSASWRAGLSWLSRRAHDRSFGDVDENGAAVTDSFTGRSRTWILDAILKWAPHGNGNLRSLKLQAEYLQRTEDGQLAQATAQQQLSGDYHARQSGWYVQGVYQFLPRWRFGLRYDSLDSGVVTVGLVQQGVLSLADFGRLAAASPSRVSAMFDWNPSEFSRLRLQYAWDEARASVRDQQLMLQYLYSIGAHGAHKF